MRHEDRVISRSRRPSTAGGRRPRIVATGTGSRGGRRRCGFVYRPGVDGISFTVRPRAYLHRRIENVRQDPTMREAAAASRGPGRRAVTSVRPSK